MRAFIERHKLLSPVAGIAVLAMSRIADIWVIINDVVPGSVRFLQGFKLPDVGGIWPALSAVLFVIAVSALAVIAYVFITDARRKPDARVVEGTNVPKPEPVMGEPSPSSLRSVASTAEGEGAACNAGAAIELGTDKLEAPTDTPHRSSETAAAPEPSWVKETRPTVAIHYVGVGTGYTAPGISDSPLDTHFVTPARANELLSMKGPALEPLFKLGEAPLYDPEAERDLAAVTKQLDEIIENGTALVGDLERLTGDELDPMNVAYWRNRTTSWDQNSTAFITHRVHGWGIDAAASGFGELDVQPHWRDVLVGYAKDRLSRFLAIRQGVGLDHIGYRARRVDPTTRLTYNSKWARGVEMSAGADGTIRPRNREEVQVLEGYGFPYAD